MPKSAAQRQADYRDRHPDKIAIARRKTYLDNDGRSYRYNYRLHTLNGWAASVIDRLKTTSNKWKYNIDSWHILNLWRQQSGRCAITGFKMLLEAPAHHPMRPSLDRIDNSKGYNEDNIRLIWAWINIARNRWSDKTFKKMCQIVSRQIINAKSKEI